MNLVDLAPAHSLDDIITRYNAWRHHDVPEDSDYLAVRCWVHNDCLSESNEYHNCSTIAYELMERWPIFHDYSLHGSDTAIETMQHSCHLGHECEHSIDARDEEDEEEPQFTEAIVFEPQTDPNTNERFFGPLITFDEVTG